MGLLLTSKIYGYSKSTTRPSDIYLNHTKTICSISRWDYFQDLCNNIGRLIAGDNILISGIGYYHGGSSSSSATETTTNDLCNNLWEITFSNH